MTVNEIREKFLEFFKNKSHQLVASASLLPADPTALFTSAGMQQFVPYLSGQVEPPYRRACSVQKCFRTSDIDEVGDEFHHTFFEMLGNWSFGDYFKKEAIEWSLELLTQIYCLPKDRLWVTVFKGNGEVSNDEEAVKIWQNNGVPTEKIKEFGIEDNFWGPVGSFGPCGPCSEIHYDRGVEFKKSECTIKGCGPNCGCGRFVEIWNLVFMEYDKTKDGQYKKLPAKNVDTGAGLERLSCILQGRSSDYEIESFLPLIKEIEKNCFEKKDDLAVKKSIRIIADHLRGICFLVAGGVIPSKEDRGYVLRRLIRRAMRHGRLIGAPTNLLVSLAQIIINEYKNIYPELDKNQADIITVIQKEEEKFNKTLTKGLKKFKKIIQQTIEQKQIVINAETIFHLYDTYGFPLELTKEMVSEYGLVIDEKSFEREFKIHQDISRAGVAKKFGGVGEWGKKVAAHHTATHLLHQALRRVLGVHVQQAGSDLTPERLRFDFTHSEKLTQEQIKKVEEIVNDAIKQELEVEMEEMSYEQAVESGALAFFKEKYPKIVRVYSIFNALTKQIFSKEICAGPHVKNTKEIGQFKIIKEEANAAGIRRIKAVIGR